MFAPTFYSQDVKTNQCKTLEVYELNGLSCRVKRGQVDVKTIQQTQIKLRGRPAVARLEGSNVEADSGSSGELIQALDHRQ